MDWRKVIENVVKDLLKGISAGEISAKFHNAVASAIAEAAVIIRKKTGINKVLLSGGVFQNRYLSEKVLSILEEKGFQTYFPSNIPPNDGGISLGQAYIAYLLKEEGAI